jgi:hypothetical protein
VGSHIFGLAIVFGVKYTYTVPAPDKKLLVNYAIGISMYRVKYSVNSRAKSVENTGCYVSILKMFQ